MKWIKQDNNSNGFKKYKFIPLHFILGITIFILVNLIFYYLNSKYNFFSKEPASGFPIIIMLFFVIFAVITDRSWNIIKRIFWGIGTLFIEGFLALHMKMLVGEPKDMYNFSGDGVDYSGTTLASLIIVIWAMRRSRYFVKQIEE